MIESRARAQPSEDELAQLVDDPNTHLCLILWAGLKWAKAHEGPLVIIV